MKQVFLLVIIILLSCGCQEKPIEDQRYFRDERAVQAMWNSAVQVKFSTEIVGTWISTKGDLPKDFDVQSYDMSFGKDGGGSFTQVSKDGATGLPFAYEIRQSKLFASTAGPPLDEWGEVRKYKGLMLMKSKDKTTVFRQAKGN